MLFYHDQLKTFIHRPPNPHLLSYVTHQASLVIPCHHSMIEEAQPLIPPLGAFVNLLVKRAYIRTGTLLASLVLLDRLRQRLTQFARGMPCTCQRIFLATLIVTTKCLHDTSPKNKHWTKFAVYFTLAEINLMEKQFLSLIDYQLVITERDLLYSFMAYSNISSSIPRSLSCSINDRKKKKESRQRSKRHHSSFSLSQETK
ncbi:hypothetical protein EDC96DRAFT_451714 [Choanephora cucurbitarum]|nr:hypothetical protein EDC96DRAFT_451714 [Choanephora cucurbitarum]